MASQYTKNINNLNPSMSGVQGRSWPNPYPGYYQNDVQNDDPFTSNRQSPFTSNRQSPFTSNRQSPFTRSSDLQQNQDSTKPHHGTQQDAPDKWQESYS